MIEKLVQVASIIIEWKKNKMVSNIFAINNSSSSLPLASPYIFLQNSQNLMILIILFYFIKREGKNKRLTKRELTCQKIRLKIII